MIPILAALLLLLLAACGPATPTTPPPEPALPLLDPTPRSTGPVPTVASQNGALPGRLLFVSAGDVWLWQGEHGSQLTRGGTAAHPAWSPDGTQVAYIERGESYSDLVVLPLTGGAAQRLTDNGSRNPLRSFERIYDVVWAFYPAWSPDGSLIAFVSQYGPPAGSPASDPPLALYRTTAAPGGTRTLLFADPTGHVGRLAYAPDGSEIVFAFGPNAEKPPRLLRFDLASEQVAPLDAPEQSYDPAFSPDGRWLAFVMRDAAGTDIFALPANGGAPVRLTSSGAARAPVFSPDGNSLAFLAIAPGEVSFDMWVIDLGRAADGSLVPGSPRRITTDLGIDAGSGLAWGK
jgi:TolB protein